MQVIGVPKTIDNDLMEMDHTPGYATCARFFACAVRDHKPKLLEKRFGDIGRGPVRQKSVEVALDLLAEAALAAPGRP